MPDASPAAEDFDLERFLPYLLNQAAETTSKSFQTIYRTTYGMTRTQWRVMANLGRFGAMAAAEICRISFIEKTKVSRAVAALEERGFLVRSPNPADRRQDVLSLTDSGRAVFAELGHHAVAYDRALRDRLGSETAARLDAVLRSLIGHGSGND